MKSAAAMWLVGVLAMGAISGCGRDESAGEATAREPADIDAILADAMAPAKLSGGGKFVLDVPKSRFPADLKLDGAKIVVQLDGKAIGSGEARGGLFHLEVTPEKDVATDEVTVLLQRDGTTERTLTLREFLKLGMADEED